MFAAVIAIRAGVSAQHVLNKFTNAHNIIMPLLTYNIHDNARDILFYIQCYQINNAQAAEVMMKLIDMYCTTVSPIAEITDKQYHILTHINLAIGKAFERACFSDRHFLRHLIDHGLYNHSHMDEYMTVGDYDVLIRKSFITCYYADKLPEECYWREENLIAAIGKMDAYMVIEKFSQALINMHEYEIYVGNPLAFYVLHKKRRTSIAITDMREFVYRIVTWCRLKCYRRDVIQHMNIATICEFITDRNIKVLFAPSRVFDTIRQARESFSPQLFAEYGYLLSHLRPDEVTLDLIVAAENAVVPYHHAFEVKFSSAQASAAIEFYAPLIKARFGADCDLRAKFLITWAFKSHCNKLSVIHDTNTDDAPGDPNIFTYAELESAIMIEPRVICAININCLHDFLIWFNARITKKLAYIAAFMDYARVSVPLNEDVTDIIAEMYLDTII
jgi:hypothetical protein